MKWPSESRHGGTGPPKQGGPALDRSPDDVHPLIGHRPVDRWVEWGELTRLVDRAGDVIAVATSLDRAPATAFVDIVHWRSAVDEASRTGPFEPTRQRGHGIEL